MRKKALIKVFALGFLAWSIFTYLFFFNAKDRTYNKDSNKLVDQLAIFQQKLNLQVKNDEEFLLKLKNFSQKVIVKDLPKPSNSTRLTVSSDVIPILVLACNRASVTRNLNELINLRPSATEFPIIVSLDCGHKPTIELVRSFGDKVHSVLIHTNMKDIPLPAGQKKFQGYYKIARHYKWALNQIFHVFNFKGVIIVEDDLDISPDFFEYFRATYSLLKMDPTLWCVSAWNDNGKASLIDNDPHLLYRTDFFPGLGWMMLRNLWLEFEPKWPKTFWDDWMRHPDQRKGRSCIRPEISRTSTFGKVGVSKGQFFEKHLKFIKLNTVSVNFTQQDLSPLLKFNYDIAFMDQVYTAPLVSVTDALTGNYPINAKSMRIQYITKKDLIQASKKLDLMEDIKSGVPRTGYRGIVSFYKNHHRFFLAPPPSWRYYNSTWN